MSFTTVLTLLDVLERLTAEVKETIERINKTKAKPDQILTRIETLLSFRTDKKLDADDILYTPTIFVRKYFVLTDSVYSGSED